VGSDHDEDTRIAFLYNIKEPTIDDKRIQNTRDKKTLNQKKKSYSEGYEYYPLSRSGS